jgi:hypothetical protein
LISSPSTWVYTAPFQSTFCLSFPLIGHLLNRRKVDTKAPHNWKTIALLIEEGADPWYRIRIGRGLFTYPQIATVMGNPEVAERLEEVAMEKPEDEETDVSSSC